MKSGVRSKALWPWVCPVLSMDVIPPRTGTHAAQRCAQVLGIITRCATKSSIATHNTNRIVMPSQSLTRCKKRWIFDGPARRGRSAGVA